MAQEFNLGIRAHKFESAEIRVPPQAQLRG
jgi:hypothetical protein